MKTIFSTADVHPRDRFALWHTAARQYVTDHDSHPGFPPSEYRLACRQVRRQ